MKIAVVGSRGFTDYELLKFKLDNIHNRKPITVIISGGAMGADSLGERWAKENNMSTDEAEKLWNKAQKLAKKELDTDKEDDRFYAYTTGIFKKMMGVSESSLLNKF